MARPPVENKSKYRRWKSVVHNVRSDCLKEAEDLIQAIGPIRSQIAVEPYTHQDGHHLHIYFAFKNQKHFNSLLKELERISNSIRDSTSEKGKSTGRVELSQWTPGQTWENINKYLVAPTKQKITGEVSSTNNYKPMWSWEMRKYIVIDVSQSAQKRREAVRKSDLATVKKIYEQVALIPPDLNIS